MLIHYFNFLPFAHAFHVNFPASVHFAKLSYHRITNFTSFLYSCYIILLSVAFYMHVHHFHIVTICLS